MGFRLVPKSVTLNGFERCNGRYYSFTLKVLDFEQTALKWAKLDLHCVRQKCSPKNLVLVVYDRWQIGAIFAEITKNECIKESHPSVKSDNLINAAR